MMPRFAAIRDTSHVPSGSAHIGHFPLGCEDHAGPRPARLIVFVESGLFHSMGT